MREREREREREMWNKIQLNPEWAGWPYIGVMACAQLWVSHSGIQTSWQSRVSQNLSRRTFGNQRVILHLCGLHIVKNWDPLRSIHIGRCAKSYGRWPEKAMAPHSSPLAWKIPWTEEPGRLQSMGSRRVGHDWATSLSPFTFMLWRRQWQPAPVFLPGESQGRGSLVGCRLRGRTESDTTDVTWRWQQYGRWPSRREALRLGLGACPVREGNSMGVLLIEILVFKNRN